MAPSEGLSTLLINGGGGLEVVRPVLGLGWQAPARVQAAWQLKLTGLPSADFLFITVRAGGGGH